MKRKFATTLALALVLIPAAAFGQDEDAPPNAIEDIALDMQEVFVELTAFQTGKPTQEMQTKIVGKLDKLIEELEREQQSMEGTGSGANPNRPLNDSKIIGGPGGMGDLHAERRVGKQWGELPPHQREKILQSKNEGFPPHYQKILERYFKRLAEEKSADVGEMDDPTATDESSANSSKPSAKPAAKKPAPDSAKPKGAAADANGSAEKPKSKDSSPPEAGK